MDKKTIRHIVGAERQDVMYRLASYAFRSTPPMPDAATIHDTIARREHAVCLGIEIDGDILATAASTPLTQNVRGRLLGMGGVFWVVTQPQARKRGYCKALMRELLACIRADNRPVSCLYPFRESFYERMGYVTFPQMKQAVFAPSALLPVMDFPHRGAVEFTLLADCLDAFRAYLAKIQLRTHGMAFFDVPDEQPDVFKSVWAAMARVDGEICGAMLYQLRGEHPTEFTMKVSRFYAHTGPGRYLLLDWIARHTDQARSVEMTLPAFELPETWLSDLNPRVETFYTAPMGRVIDIERLEGIDVGSGEFTIELTDPLCPWQEGCWRLVADEGILRVSRGTAADCRMDVRALSALVYGTHDPEDFNSRGWAELSPDHVIALRALFPRKTPYLHSYF